MTKPGKKIGTLRIDLDRKKTGYQRARFEIDLRLEVSTGEFHAEYEGTWYRAYTKGDLAAQVKEAVSKTLDLEWRRYLVIDYSAVAHEIDDPKVGRPRSYGRVNHLDIDTDRAELAGKSRMRDPEDEDDGKDLGWEDEPMVITELGLTWKLLEISEPYACPEDKAKRVRAFRAVSFDGRDGSEEIGDPEEQDDDALPAGAVLWTADREAFLSEVLAKLGELDRALAQLFGGGALALAQRLDERTFFAGLLPAGGGS